MYKFNVATNQLPANDNQPQRLPIKYSWAFYSLRNFLSLCSILKNNSNNVGETVNWSDKDKLMFALCVKDNQS